MESQKPCLILVVENEKVVEEYIGEVLKQYGYLHASFKDSYRALEYFSINEERVDLIVTEAKMDLIDGIELAKKATRMKPGISVILLADTNEKLPETVSLPNVQALQKPVSKEALVHMVEGVIKGCRLRPDRGA